MHSVSCLLRNIFYYLQDRQALFTPSFFVELRFFKRLLKWIWQLNPPGRFQSLLHIGLPKLNSFEACRSLGQELWG